MAINNDAIKQQLSMTKLLLHYGGKCTNNASGAWWCIMHESGGNAAGHRTPSLVAKDEIGKATCMSKGCFQADDIFGVIAKMERLDIKIDFKAVKQKACDIAGIGYERNDSKGIEKKYPIEALNQKHIEYLANLKISQLTANRFGLKARYDYILYPQLENGAVIGYKGISILKDKKTGKSKQFFENRKASLFHETEIGQGKHLIFTEGEKDCLRLSEEITNEGVQDKFVTVTVTTGSKTVPSDLLKRIEELKPSDISIIYDRDEAGRQGAERLAKAIVKQEKTVSLYYFPENKEEGYDLTDFLNEGNRFKAIWDLKSKLFQQKIRIIKNVYPHYIVNQQAIIDTLSPDRVLYTGYKQIDEKCPIILGENTIIAGRTGKGKTVLGVNIINGILKNNNNAKVLVISLELKKKSFLQRLLSAEYNIETWKIKKGFVAEDNTIFSIQKEQYLKSGKLYTGAYEDRLMIIDDIHSIEHIEQLLNSLKKEFEYVPDYVLIDYVNILTLKNLVDATKHIQISTWIKFLAKERNIHVQVVCQANRATKENDDGYARTENLADSDQYGRDAFIVYSIKTDKDSDYYSINPTKNRNGKPEEEIKLLWNAKTGQIARGKGENIGYEI